MNFDLEINDTKKKAKIKSEINKKKKIQNLKNSNTDNLKVDSIFSFQFFKLKKKYP